MIRLVALVALLSGVASFGQGQSKEQECQAVCGQAMGACMMPCMGDPKEAAKPENKSKTMACVKTCSDAQKPCLNACKAKGKGN